MGKLDGKVAIITGSAQGLGRGYAKVFAREGAAVTVLDCRAEEDGLAVVEEIKAEGGKAIYVPCDITDKAQVENVVAKTIEAFGKIDILVNNAGIDAPLGEFVELITEESATKLWRTTFLGTLYFMQACFPYLKETKGSIINTGSGTATVAAPTKGNYAAGKGSVASLSFVAANEWGRHGIRVNIIIPGARTEMYENNTRKNPEAAKASVERSALKYLGDPEKDVAPVVVFLASDDSHYLTAHTLHADTTPSPRYR